jgi:LPXTG-site transpeptidase (sortase) family protein
MQKKRKYTRKIPKLVKQIDVNYFSFIASILGIIGGIMIIGGILYLTYERSTLSFSNTPSQYLHNIRRPGSPIKISIPAIDINVSVKEATIKNGIWQTDRLTALHLNSSANPGEYGNIIIYGHNTPNIFKNLSDAKIGNSVIITTDSGIKNAYIINTIQTVSPNTISLIRPTKEEVLTIYTCTGFFDNQRLVIQAHPAFNIGIKPLP